MYGRDIFEHKPKLFSDMNDKKPYKEQLLDPRWQKKKTEILQRDKFTCKCCGRTDLTLHVHHTQYQKCKNAWDYNNEYLITLCECCHQRIHNGYEWQEMDSIKIGEVYSREHGDFTDYMLCYNIDHILGRCYLIGIDTGGSYDTLYYRSVFYTTFLSKYRYEENFFNKNLIDDYFQAKLYENLFRYTQNKGVINIDNDYLGNKDMLINNLEEILNNNQGLKYWFNFAVCDPYFIDNL